MEPSKFTCGTGFSAVKFWWSLSGYDKCICLAYLETLSFRFLNVKFIFMQVEFPIYQDLAQLPSPLGALVHTQVRIMMKLRDTVS